jgi:ATP-dependent DNA ligase
MSVPLVRYPIRFTMSRVVKRSTSRAIKADQSHRGVPLPRFIPPQLSLPVEKPPSGPKWLHEIKLDGYRYGRVSTMAMRSC